MNVTSTHLSLPGEQKDCLRIICENELNSATAFLIRDELSHYEAYDFPAFYIDVKDVREADLSGINEIINCYYRLNQKGRAMVLVYRKHSIIEQWVSKTGIDKFMTTAIVPA